MKRINLSVDPVIWRDFRVACLRRNLSASKEFERFMHWKLSVWQQEEDPLQSESAFLRLRTPPTSQLRDLPNITFEVQGRPLPEPHKETTP